MKHPTTEVWLEQLGTPSFERVLRGLLGPRDAAVRAQVEVYRRLIEAYRERYGAGEVRLVRAPGRVNLVGMHIDHRGGHVNPIAVQEVTLAVGAREDDRICLANLNPSFTESEFRLSEVTPSQPVQDWTTWTQQQTDARRSAGTAGHWDVYVKSAAVYLQDQLRSPDGTFEPRLRGMNVVADGSVPIASGLSSSSAVVVSSMMALLDVHGLQLRADQIVDLCGTAEWYVGTRGGKGDHAAILLGRQGQLSHIGFFPLEVSHAPFPPDYRVVVCNSHVEAKKSTNARDTFNQRVTAYEIALHLLKQRFPNLAPVSYFRDLLDPALCHAPDDPALRDPIAHEAFLYDALMALPMRLTRSAIEALLPKSALEALGPLYQSHAAPADGYRIRGVALFGLAECLRSQLAATYLHEGDLAGFGRLISLSHEGDRVCQNGNGVQRSFSPDISDGRLATLREQLLDSNPARHEAARIASQPGAYAVSCEELDSLVDAIRSVPGVLGAGRIGAGLGGCISVFVHADQVDALKRAVTERYYGPRDLPVAVDEYFPVEGAGRIDLPGANRCE